MTAEGASEVVGAPAMEDASAPGARPRRPMRWARKHRVWLALGAAAGLAAAWRWTPLSEWLEMERLQGWAEAIEAYRFTPLLVLGIYVVASTAMIPVNLLVLVTALTFEPFPATVYAFGGSLAAAVGTFWLGRLLGRDAVQRLAVEWVDRLNRKLARSGVIAVATIRLLPLAPFGIINMVAGTSELRFRDFALGSALGMTPGIIAIVLFENRLEHAIRNPGPASVALLLAATAVVVFLFVWVRRKLNDSPRSGGEG